MKPLLPTLKERQRYIVYEVISAHPMPDISETLLHRLSELLGVFGMADAGILSVSYDIATQTGILRVNSSTPCQSGIAHDHAPGKNAGQHSHAWREWDPEEGETLYARERKENNERNNQRITIIGRRNHATNATSNDGLRPRYYHVQP
jgi:hypothetical protein